jgi:mannosyltransferase OCH1-like enzyme
MVKIDINYLKQARKNANRNKISTISPQKTIIQTQPVQHVIRPLSQIFPLKQYYNSVIPQNIFQTWHTKELSPLMFTAMMKIKQTNPRFNHFLFDDKDCRNFIQKYFAPDVLYAYDSLIPGAYKADLWRYCVLFIKGGIYLDIKYAPLSGFKFINLTESEHLAIDIDGRSIYNALMVCKSGNQNLLRAIRKIVDNVRNKYYGENYLSPTGPGLLSSFISPSDPIVDLKHEVKGDENNKIIIYKGVPILKSYHGHIKDKLKYSVRDHYSVLWKNKNIYA